MRITDTTLADQLSGNLESQQATITNLDEELSSGEALQKPSDNPVAVADTLAYKRQIAQAASAQSNATTAQSWLGIGNQTANQVVDTLQSVNTTVLQALNSGTNNAQSYSEMAQQVQGQISQLVGLANTQYGSTAIFAGTAGVSQPFSSTGTYSGNSQAFTISVGSGAPVAVSVPGDQLFGGGTSGVQSVFTTLQNIVTHLQQGPGSASYASLQSDFNDLAANMSQAESAATTLGESTQEVTAASTAAQNTSTQLQQILATTQSADVPTVTAALQSDLTTYQAALYAVSQTVPETLAQFLK
ncbi:MAG: flagellar hook-associated protein FlgL [Acidimicrobiales bacterium]|jgi:flagellar hook-associated protein 3 FlgL